MKRIALLSWCALVVVMGCDRDKPEEKPTAAARTIVPKPVPTPAKRKLEATSAVEIVGYGGAYKLHVGVSAWLPMSVTTDELLLGRKGKTGDLGAMLVPRTSPNHQKAQQAGKILVNGTVGFGQDPDLLDQLLRSMAKGPVEPAWRVRAFGVVVPIPRGFVVNVSESPAWEMSEWGSLTEGAFIKLAPLMRSSDAPKLDELALPNQQVVGKGRVGTADYVELEYEHPVGKTWRRRHYLEHHGELACGLAVQSPLDAFKAHVAAADTLVTGWRIPDE